MVDTKNISETTEETPLPEVTDTEVTPAEPSEPVEGGDNQEIIDIINRFVEGADTSSPEAIISSALKALQQMTPIYDKVYDLVETDPQSASFVADVLETGNVAKAIARNYNPSEFRALCEEVEENDDYESDRTEYSDRVSKQKARADLVGKNKEVSLQNISKFMEDRKDWSPEKAEEFQSFVIAHYNDGADGLIKEADLSILEKGFNYDGDIAEAEDNGKVIGRNEQIVAKTLSKNEKEELLPEHSTGKVTPPSKPDAKKSFASKFLEDF